MRVFKNKNNKKEEKVVELTLDSSENVSTETVNKITEAVADVVTTELVKDEKKEEARTRRSHKKEEKVPCKVLLAKPSYFVIEKNGEKITINKKNNYHRGEGIYY